ncbi:MAG: hypothetical protein HYV37_02015 [Candidatus Levyibacteriota bacterium]|nr:MAG: hypothetical protein HYV37_02015 [Candidatus Levybacteria bacterium]
MKHWGFFIILAISFWAVRSLFAPGFFPIHDDTQVARVFEMGKVLQTGVFPARWVPDLGYGYGYPIFNYYAPLAYYVGGIITLIGVDALIATKIMIGLGVLLAGIFMYFLVRELWGELGGIIAALFYIYAPYHALQIYVRGAVGELWSYAFIPLVFYGLYKIYTEKKWKWVIVGSIGYTGVILSHNLTAIMLTPFLLIVILFYCFIFYKNRQLYAIRYSLYAVLLGLLLSAFYWIPAVFEMQYTNVQSQIGGGADFRDHFVCLNQLWDSPWGFGGSTKGCIDGLSFKIGKLHLITVIMSLFVVLSFIWRRRYIRLGIILFSLVGFFASVFLMLEISKSIWETVPLIAFFQYPWRFLLFTSFFSSFLVGAIVWFLEQEFGKVKYFNTILYLSTAILVFLLLFFNIKLFQPQTILLKTAQDYTNDRALKWIASKTSDEYLPTNVKLPISDYDIPKKNTNEKSVAVTVENQKDLFKRYKDQLPPLRFEQTNLEKIANILSVIGIGVLIIGIIYARKK